MASRPPQSLEEIREALLAVWPSWAREPEEILDAHVWALAEQFQRSQEADQTLHNRTFIDRADGSWLEEHGRERGKFRREAEGEEEFRARVRLVDDKLTGPAILAAVNPVLLIGEATLTEHPVNDPTFVPPAGTTFFSLGIIGRSNSFTSRRAYTLAVPDQAPLVRDTAFTNETGSALEASTTFTWEQDEAGSPPSPGMYTADVNGPVATAVYTKIMEILDALTAAGVQARPIVVS